MSRPPVLPAAAPAQLAAVRQELTKAGYTEEGLRKRLGVAAAPPLLYLAALADPPLVVAPGGPAPLDRLIQLLLGREPVARAEIDRALAPEAVSALLEVQVLQVSGGDYLATCALYPVGQLYCCVDFAIGERPLDGVLLPDPAGMAGLRFLEPAWDDERGLAVCLGAGCGLHALQLATLHGYQRVRAHDDSPRARQLIALNAALNGAKVEVLAEPPGPSRDADLLVALVPCVLRSSALWAARLPAAEDEARLDRAWAQVEPLLAEKGRAILCQQGRGETEWLPKKLSVVPGMDALEVVWVPVLGSALGDDEQAEFGVAVARRRRPGFPQLLRAGSVFGLPTATARGLSLHLDSRRMIRDLDGDDLLKLVPYRNGRVSPQQGFGAAQGQPLVRGPAVIGTMTWPAEVVDLLSGCDNVRTVSEVAGGDPAKTRLLMMLALDGAVFLRQAE